MTPVLTPLERAAIDYVMVHQVEFGYEGDDQAQRDQLKNLVDLAFTHLSRVAQEYLP